MQINRVFASILLLLLSVNLASTTRAQTGPVTAFVNVNLVPLTEEVVVPGQTVLVQDKRIIAIGSSKAIHLPDNAKIIAEENAYLMPGLADMHMHTRDHWFRNTWPVPPMNLYLANGVTTIRCFGPDKKFPEKVLYWREAVRNGRLAGPAIYSCGAQLRGYLDNPEKIVRRQKTQGFDFIKFYSYLTREEFHRALTAAKEVNMYTAGHIPFQVGLDGVLAQGMNEIAHIEELFWEFVDIDRKRYFDNENDWMTYVIRTTFQQFSPYLDADREILEEALSNQMRQIARKVKAKGIPVCTTLYLDEVIVEKLTTPETFLSKPENRYLPPIYLEAFKQGREKHQRQFRGGETFAPFKRMADLMLLKHLKTAGVEILVGTDAGTGWMGLVPGYSLHDELDVLVKNGFTPYEAIVAGTKTASQVVQKMVGSDDFGTIEIGKRADLLLVSQNPLEDVAYIKDPLGVMAAGNWYDSNALKKMTTPGIPVTGTIHHVYEPDRSQNTYIDIAIGPLFRGELPDAIEAVTVSGPAGNLVADKDDFTYLPKIRDFWARIPGAPAIGTYTFKLTSNAGYGSTADIQSSVRIIPLPDPGTFTPKNRAVLHSNSPTFSWGAIGSEEFYYYRLEINRPRGGRVYATGYVKGMLYHTVPEGHLEAGQPYAWRVRVVDAANWLDVQNRSQSDWQDFSIKAN